MRMETSVAAPPPPTTKCLWQIMRAVFIMLREGLAKRRHLIADYLRLHLLLRQGKLAGKTLRGLICDLSHHPPSAVHSGAAAFSCRFMDPDAAVYAPREVEFSCSNTPFYSAARRRTNYGGGRRHRDRNYDAAAVARAFEILDKVADDAIGEEESPVPSVMATPGATVMPLRVSDSPFPEKEEEKDEAVDRAAEEFIRRFYEQLRRQHMRGY